MIYSIKKLNTTYKLFIFHISIFSIFILFIIGISPCILQKNIKASGFLILSHLGNPLITSKESSTCSFPAFNFLSRLISKHIECLLNKFKTSSFCNVSAIFSAKNTICSLQIGPIVFMTSPNSLFIDSKLFPSILYFIAKLSLNIIDNI